MNPNEGTPLPDELTKSIRAKLIDELSVAAIDIADRAATEIARGIKKERRLELRRANEETQ